MAHRIMEHDQVKSIEGKEWHGLAIVEPEITFGNSGLDWEVEGQTLYRGDDFKQTSGKCLVRKDKDIELTIAKGSYEIIQNARIWEALETALTGINYKVTTSGSLDNGRKIFISIAIDGQQDYMVNGDKFKNFISFVSSHDGTMAFEAFDSSVRIVCANTLAWSRKQKGIMNLKVFHSKNCEVKISGMEEQIERMMEKRIEFYSTYEGLCARPMSEERAENIVAGWLGGSSKELSKVSFNQTQKIVNLFKNGAGNGGNTYSDLLNGVTEFYTHHFTDNKGRLAGGAFMGSQSDNKLEFWDTMQNEGELRALSENGKRLLATVS